MITLAIKAFFDTLTQGMHTYETSIENRTTTEVVKDKTNLKKASDICEEILEITDCYVHYFTEKDFDRYQKLKHKFLKYN